MYYLSLCCVKTTNILNLLSGLDELWKEEDQLAQEQEEQEQEMEWIFTYGASQYDSVEIRQINLNFKLKSNFECES